MNCRLLEKVNSMNCKDSVAELVRVFELTTSIALAHDLKVVGSSPERVDSAHHYLNK